MMVQVERFTCLACQHVFESEIVTHAPLKVALAALKAVRCPKCRSSKVGIGGALPGAQEAGGSITERAERWWKLGERGVSSQTIYHVFTGGYVSRKDVPYDPDDFRRCRLLLDLMPEWRRDLGKLSSALPWYAPFVENWDEMDRLYDAELPKRQMLEIVCSDAATR